MPPLLKKSLGVITTFKLLVGITRSGAFSFVSDLYSRATSDHAGWALLKSWSLKVMSWQIGDLT